MLFNSIDFAFFLPIVFVLYWVLFQRNIQRQNLLIAIASYIFYGWWNWRFLTLILFSTVVDYTLSLRMSKHSDPKKRKILLGTSLLVNLGLLGFFKYYNFFIANFVEAFSLFGQEITIRSLHIILPVGISFYTFQTLSYSIDVYRRKIEPTTDFVAFSAFVSFFPQLVAGPIERASNLLPQFHKERRFDYFQAVDGTRQILWGFFKKMVIADNCAKYADIIFHEPNAYSSVVLIFGAVMFAFQIYGDFSGYSDIAIGTSKLFGFNLMKNFAFPYFSRDMAEFWRRWHISLSTWFRDYLYIPLGGSQRRLKTTLRNTFIIFLVSGFWHGANWTFILWGALHAAYFVPLLLFAKNRRHLGDIAPSRVLPTFRDVGSISITFALTVLAWIPFRADNIHHTMEYYTALFTQDFFGNISLQFRSISNGFHVVYIGIILLLFILFEWVQRNQPHGLFFSINHRYKTVRISLYYLLVTLIFAFSGAHETFIYFQF